MVQLNSPPIRPDHNAGIYITEEDIPNEAEERPLKLESGTEVEIECQVTLDHRPEWPIVHAFLDDK